MNTDNSLAVAVCGTLFAFVGGQPMIILGGTGPMLVLTALLYTLCEEFGLPFLPNFYTALAKSPRAMRSSFVAAGPTGIGACGIVWMALPSGR